MGRRLAAGIVLLLLLAGTLGGESSAVLGGRAISIRSAPWTVSVRDSFGFYEGFDCSGVIIDAVHVLTAAHCLFNDSGLFVRPSQITVRAGVSNFRRPWMTDHPQLRGVASIRLLPGYVWSEGSESSGHVGTDIAVLRLSRPFNLAGNDVQAVTLPAKNARRPSGPGFMLAGYGREHASQESSGALHVMSADLIRVPGCSSARTLCAFSPGRSSCPGDSGAGLVSSGPVPTLVGLLITGACTSGLPSSYVDVAATPILEFLDGRGGVSVPTEPPATRWVPAGWTSQPGLSPHGFPLSFAFSLPRTWISGTTPSGVHNYFNPSTGAEASTFDDHGFVSRTDYFTHVLAEGKAKYVGQDPAAVVHSRMVKLPAGPALEIIVHLTARIDGRRYVLSIENYNLFRNGVGYDIEYQGPPSQDGVDIPVWELSAHTIHFVAARR